MKTTTTLQFFGQEYELKILEDKIKLNWKKMGKKLKDIKEMNIYIKPEENKVYYVINNEERGYIEL